MRRLLVLLAVIAGVGMSGLPRLEAQSTVRHYIILGKTQGHGSTAFERAVVAAGGTVTAVIPEIGVVLADSTKASFLKTVVSAPGVQQAAEDGELQWLSPRERVVVARAAGGEAFGLEPYADIQWNMRQIHADGTAANGDLGRGARVAVLDAGLMTDHPDIAVNVNTALSRSFVPGENVDPVEEGFNHGTHVAGIIAAAVNGIGTQGVAPEAELVAVKVLRESGSGSFSWLIQGIVYAASIQADVINMSLGTTFDRNNSGGDGAGPLLAALNRAINHASAAGSLCVSSAGNEGVDLNSRVFSIPAQSGHGIAVAATGPQDFYHLGDAAVFDRPASYTNYGQSVVSVAAPGGDYTLYEADGWFYDMVISPAGFTLGAGGRTFEYYFAAGTSMAAPHVSGLAALIVGKYGHIGPAAIKARILDSADDILRPGADGLGRGRINALKALQ